MAKKRFKSELSYLFDETPEERPAPRPTRKEKTTAEPKPAERKPDQKDFSLTIDIPVADEQTDRKLSGKGFTQDLDAFLSESFEEQGLSTGPTKPSFQARPMPRRRRKTGLDLLIRSTVEKTDADEGPARASDQKMRRVTLVFQPDHLQELKELAKEKNVFLKDLMGDIVADYLRRAEG